MRASPHFSSGGAGDSLATRTPPGKGSAQTENHLVLTNRNCSRLAFGQESGAYSDEFLFYSFIQRPGLFIKLARPAVAFNLFAQR
jgi:hypothetical protein